MQAYFEEQRDLDFLLHIEQKKNDHCEPHFHSNIELLYVQKGSIRVTIGEHTAILPKGSLAVSNSFEVHAYHAMTEAESVFAIVPVEMLQEYVRVMEHRRFVCPFLLPGHCDAEIRQSISRLLVYDKTGGSLRALGHIQILLGILLEQLEVAENTRTNAHTDQLIRQILLYLNQHYREPVTLERLAQIFNYNKTYLSRVFNAYVDSGFSAYVNRLRTRHAARLIHISDASMEHIAGESGFSSVRSFNRAFYNLYHLTPVEYKKHKQFPTSAGRDTDRIFYIYSYFPSV